MKLDLPRKTGFRVLDIHKPVIILDSRGKVFYDTSKLLGKVLQFNLPAGTYEVKTGANIQEMPEPRMYKIPRLPDKQHKFPKPMNFKILWDNNKSKCTINFFKETITFDESFKEKTLPEIYFVLYHEYAHQFYKTEKFADLLSTVYMYEKGYNTSQIIDAQDTSLSDKQTERKKFISDNLIYLNGLNA